MIGKIKLGVFLTTFLVLGVSLFALSLLSESKLLLRIDPGLSYPPFRVIFLTLFPLVFLMWFGRYVDKLEIFWPSFAALVGVIAYTFLVLGLLELRNHPKFSPFLALPTCFIIMLGFAFFMFRFPNDHELFRGIDVAVRESTRKEMVSLAFLEFFAIIVPISYVSVKTLV